MRSLTAAATLAAITIITSKPVFAQTSSGRIVEAQINEQLTSQFGTYADTAGGWTGADSAYSVQLSGGEVAWLYSDTFLGKVNEDHSRPGDVPFIHNSIVIDDGRGKLTTYVGGTPAKPENLVSVRGADNSTDWYWFGDGIFENGTLRVMLLEFLKTGDQLWDFAFKQNAIASFTYGTMKLESITPYPTITDNPIQWGSAILEDGGYIYVYGVEDLGLPKYMHLARVPYGSLTNTSAWTYWTGSDWSTAQSRSIRIMDGVSNEYSVTPFEGKYTLVTGDSTEIFSPNIVMYQSDYPIGPFVNKTLLYTTPETLGNIFTYNPKAHPSYGSDTTLMITYNVNSFDMIDVYTDVLNYRPRYIDVKPHVPEPTTTTTTLAPRRGDRPQLKEAQGRLR